MHVFTVTIGKWKTETNETVPPHCARPKVQIIYNNILRLKLFKQTPVDGGFTPTDRHLKHSTPTTHTLTVIIKNSDSHR